MWSGVFSSSRASVYSTAIAMFFSHADGYFFIADHNRDLSFAVLISFFPHDDFLCGEHRAFAVRLVGGIWSRCTCGGMDLGVVCLLAFAWQGVWGGLETASSAKVLTLRLRGRGGGLEESHQAGIHRFNISKM